MPRLRSVLRLAVLAAFAAPTLGAACGGEPSAASLTSVAAEAYVGRWIVTDPGAAPLPLGLQLARTERGLAAQVFYSGVAYDAAGPVGPNGFDLRQTNGHARLTGVLRPDGRLDVTLDSTFPATSAVPLRFVLRREE